MKFIAGLCAALMISAVGLVAQAQAPTTPRTGTETLTPAKQAQAKNLTQDVTTTGCLRAWKPAPEDVTKFPESRQPGMAGIFLLTPFSSNPNSAASAPTYLLTPTQVVNFAAHLDDKVEIVGVAQTAPMPPTVQELATEPTARPENKANTAAMPRLTVTSLKKISDSCP